MPTNDEMARAVAPMTPVAVRMQPTEAWAVVSKEGQLLDLELYRDKAEAEREVAAHRPFGVTPGCAAARVLITEGWRPIAEAPKDDKVKLLLWLEDKGSVIGYWRKDIGIWWQPYAMTIRPTHFMPLPAPPVERAAMRGEG